MHNFRTEIKVTPAQQPLAHHDRVLTIGSCFADAIGQRLKHYKFPALTNPFGVIYNPLSIDKALHYSIDNCPPAQDTYQKNQEIRLNYDFHSNLSALTQPALERKILDTIKAVHLFLKDARWLLITYGTSWVYAKKDTGTVVANCHKMPSGIFSRSLLTEREIVESFDKLYKALMTLNPQVRIILTLSPVRHVKDTLELNSVSKAILRIACHTLAEKYSHKVTYFPAFEMMIDDLRDYRFYKSDMLHPSEDAENYIWEKFADRYFTSDTKSFLKEWNRITAALNHKPFHAETTAHQNFLRDTLKKLEALSRSVDVSQELTLVREQLR